MTDARHTWRDSPIGDLRIRISLQRGPFPSYRESESRVVSERLRIGEFTLGAGEILWRRGDHSQVAFTDCKSLECPVAKTRKVADMHPRLVALVVVLFLAAAGPVQAAGPDEAEALQPSVPLCSVLTTIMAEPNCQVAASVWGLSLSDATSAVGGFDTAVVSPDSYLPDYQQLVDEAPLKEVNDELMDLNETSWQNLPPPASTPVGTAYSTWYQAYCLSNGTCSPPPPPCTVRLHPPPPVECTITSSTSQPQEAEMTVGGSQAAAAGIPGSYNLKYLESFRCSYNGEKAYFEGNTHLLRPDPDVHRNHRYFRTFKQEGSGGPKAGGGKLMEWTGMAIHADYEGSAGRVDPMDWNPKGVSDIRDAQPAQFGVQAYGFGVNWTEPLDIGYEGGALYSGRDVHYHGWSRSSGTPAAKGTSGATIWSIKGGTNVVFRTFCGTGVK